MGDIRSSSLDQVLGPCKRQESVLCIVRRPNVKDSAASHRCNPAGELSLIYPVIGTIREASHADSLERHPRVCQITPSEGGPLLLVWHGRTHAQWILRGFHVERIGRSCVHLIGPIGSTLTTLGRGSGDSRLGSP